MATKVTMGRLDRPETPSEQIINAALQPGSVVDERGRNITIQRLTPVARMRLFKALGALAGNEQYLGYAMLAASVTAIDGDHPPLPINERQIEGAVQMLGDEGLAAVARYFRDLAPEIAPADEA